MDDGARARPGVRGEPPDEPAGVATPSAAARKRVNGGAAARALVAAVLRHVGPPMRSAVPR